MFCEDCYLWIVLIWMLHSTANLVRCLEPLLLSPEVSKLATIATRPASPSSTEGVLELSSRADGAENNNISCQPSLCHRETFVGLGDHGLSGLDISHALVSAKTESQNLKNLKAQTSYL